MLSHDLVHALDVREQLLVLVLKVPQREIVAVPVQILQRLSVKVVRKVAFPVNALHQSTKVLVAVREPRQIEHSRVLCLCRRTLRTKKTHQSRRTMFRKHKLNANDLWKSLNRTSNREVVDEESEILILNDTREVLNDVLQADAKESLDALNTFFYKCTPEQADRLQKRIVLLKLRTVPSLLRLPYILYCRYLKATQRQDESLFGNRFIQATWEVIFLMYRKFSEFQTHDFFAYIVRDTFGFVIQERTAQFISSYDDHPWFFMPHFLCQMLQGFVGNQFISLIYGDVFALANAAFEYALLAYSTSENELPPYLKSKYTSYIETMVAAGCIQIVQDNSKSLYVASQSRDKLLALREIFTPRLLQQASVEKVYALLREVRDLSTHSDAFDMTVTKHTQDILRFTINNSKCRNVFAGARQQCSVGRPKEDQQFYQEIVEKLNPKENDTQPPWPPNYAPITLEEIMNSERWWPSVLSTIFQGRRRSSSDYGSGGS